MVREKGAETMILMTENISDLKIRGIDDGTDGTEEGGAEMILRTILKKLKEKQALMSLGKVQYQIRKK